MIAEEEAEKLRNKALDLLASTTEENTDALTAGRYMNVNEELFTEE